MAYFTCLPRLKRVTLSLLIISASIFLIFKKLNEPTTSETIVTLVPTREELEQESALRMFSTGLKKRIVSNKPLYLTATKPTYHFQPDNRLPDVFYSTDEYQYPRTEPSKRANACVIILARESDLKGLKSVLESFEGRFNKYSNNEN